MRLLLVEDDPRLQQTLRRMLTVAGYEIEIAPTGANALQILGEPDRPDLVVLDVGLPDIDGFEVLTKIRERDNMVGVIMLTARDALDDRVEGLTRGADDYILKPFEMPELLARLQAVSRRRAPQDGLEELRYADLHLDLSSRTARRGEREMSLRKLEWEILEVLMRAPEKLKSRSQLYQDVWGYDFDGSSNTLDVHIAHLRAELEADGQPRLIHTVRGVGYILRESE